MRDALRGSLPLALALIAVGLSSAGCSSVSSCNRDEDKIDVYGYVNADRTIFTSIEPSRLEAADGGTVPSTDQGSGPSFAHFPTNRIITFHVGLVAFPTDIHVYLSFSPDGDATVAPAAGNQSLIRKRSKDQIVLRNDTCSEFYVWLTAAASATPFHPVIDAGIDDAASDADDTGMAGAAGTP
jgi:hypothetical protein